MATRTPRPKHDDPVKEVVDNDLPRYRVIEKSFLGHSIHEEGAEVTFEGDTVGDNLSPLNDAAQAVVDAQKDPHVDKTVVGQHKPARRAADAAAAGVGDADSGEGGDLA